MEKPVLVVGSLNVDLVVQVERRPEPGETLAALHYESFLGGKGANQAVACARLGVATRMIGRVGDDTFGSTLLEGVGRAGVDVSAVARSSGSSGLAFIMTDAHAQNSIVVASGANGQLTPEDIRAQRALFARAGVVLVQLEIPLETVRAVAEVASEEGVVLLLDPAPARALTPDLLQRVRWLSPNETESRILAPDSDRRSHAAVAEGLLKLGCRNVVLKLGAAGVYLSGQDVAGTHVEGFPVEAVDTTAAGDAFNGAFGAGLAAELDPVTAAELGCAVAALSVTRLGAQASLPDEREVREFVAARRPALLPALERLQGAGR